MRKTAPCCTEKIREWRKSSAGVQPLVQPGLGHGPEPIGNPPADAQRLRRLLVTEPRDVAELHQPGGLGIVRFQFTQGLVKSKEVLVGAVGNGELIVPGDALSRPAALEGRSA